MDIEVKIKKEDPKLEWKYNHETDACFDIQSNEDVIIPAKSRYSVSTGVSLSIPDGYTIQIKSRSGLYVKHFIEAFPGVIDSDYTGEIKAVLVNHSDEDFEIKKYDRIAQAEIRPVYKANFIDTDKDHAETGRGSKGFGSSGIK